MQYIISADNFARSCLSVNVVDVWVSYIIIVLLDLNIGTALLCFRRILNFKFNWFCESLVHEKSTIWRKSEAERMLHNYRTNQK